MSKCEAVCERAELRRHKQELESQLAAMREALETLAPETSLRDWVDAAYPCPVHRGEDDDCTCDEHARRLVLRDKVNAALSTDAGQAMLERVRELDGIETTAAKLAVDYTTAVERAEKAERELEAHRQELDRVSAALEEENEARCDAELAATEMRERCAKVAEADGCTCLGRIVPDPSKPTCIPCRIAASIRALPLEET